MRTSPTTKYGTPLLVAAVTALLAMPAASSAQRRNRGDNAGFGAPVATSAILENPDVYLGKVVTISAGVERMLSRTAFLIDQRRAVSATAVEAIGKPVLVIAPYLTGTLETAQYLLVRGEIVTFDQAAIARVASGYTIDVPPEVSVRYGGQPILLATSVIDSTYTELAKKPMLPPSPADVSLTAAMKAVGPAFAGLRAAVQESQADAVARHVATLSPALAEAATILSGIGQSPAAALAREAGDHVRSIAREAGAGDWDATRTSTGALDRLCQNCHAAHRERQEDGTFRLRAGS